MAETDEFAFQTGVRRRGRNSYASTSPHPVLAFETAPTDDGAVARWRGGSGTGRAHVESDAEDGEEVAA